MRALIKIYSSHLGAWPLQAVTKIAIRGKKHLKRVPLDVLTQHEAEIYNKGGKEKGPRVKPEQFDESLDLPFGRSVIGQEAPHIRELKKLLGDSKYRNQKDQVVLEGNNIIRDALAAGGKLSKLYVSERGVHYLDGLHLDRNRCFVMSDSAMKIASDVITSPGLLAIFWRPKVKPSDKGCIPVSVICDEIRQPDNLAGILRTSASAGAHSVLLTEGSADPWQSKVVRGAAGSLFRLPLLPALPWHAVRSHIRKQPSRVYLCASPATRDRVPSSSSVSSTYHQIEFPRDKHIFVVVGNEARGLSAEARALCGESSEVDAEYLQVPMWRRMESLNVALAAGLVLYEAQRQWQVTPPTGT